MKIDKKITQTFSYGVIYIYSIPLDSHKGRLKIGSTTINLQNPTQAEMKAVADNRIKQQTKTADIPYKLEYTVLAIDEQNNYFSDYDVHNVLIRSGYKRKSENVKNIHSEWFEVSLDIAKKAIQAVKEGRKALTTEEKISKSQEIVFSFRPNQLDAIEKTTKAIKRNKKHFLWNAKMRFGKTAAAMQVAKENEMQKVLIATHRPSVKVDWYDDFNKILASADYQYASKDRGEHIKTLLKENKKFVYFVSLHDLRGSKRVVEDEAAHSQAVGFEKNEEIFDTEWDMFIVDEAHEGTQSNLGKTVFSKIVTKFTLQLSGTPFNILHKYEEENVYTWDYVMEQEAKLNWEKNNPGVPNPYAELPELNIFTYDIDQFSAHIGNFGGKFHSVMDGAFKFHEFFRVKKNDQGEEIAEFEHQEMVKKFLDLLVNDKLKTKFPYATKEYRNYNKHSLWLLPNRVKVIEAMEKLLQEHPVFGSGAFGIVNISGNAPDYSEDKDAKERVVKAIKENEYTITLTGQRLTTGASIKEWTAVFMMSDTSSATTYLQTAFRCQTPARIDGKLKTKGYVFDFAPDRTLKLIAEAVELNHKSGSINSSEQKEAMQKFLNFCPILAAEGGKMVPYDVGGMLKQLKKAIIQRVQRNGFDDPKLYNDNLLQLDEMDVSKFNELKKIVGASKSTQIKEIEINKLGMDDLQKAESARKKKQQERSLTEEEKEALKKLRKAREEKKKAINILRAVSIRMPMLVYGADISFKKDISLQDFIELVDDESWVEFMPDGLTKEKFNDFVKYYDEDVFKGVARSIRAQAQDCDNLPPTERVESLAEIFATFKNPDKETVLTPWKVVNMHITGVFGGHNFVSGIKDKTGKPMWQSGEVGENIWEKDDVKILEINSKSGLYPLLCAYNVYTRKLKKDKKLKKSEDKVYKKVWDEVLKNNIYVLCKSPMAKSITQRTLAGYTNVKTNIIYIKDLIDKMKQNDGYKDYNLPQELLTKFNLDKNMKFTAIVGNPPYQGENHQQIYPYFYLLSRKLGENVSLIFPTGWQEPKNGNNLRLLNKKEIKEDPQIVFINNKQNVFPGIPGAEWTNIILWKKRYNNGLDGKQKIYIEGKDEKIIKLQTEKNHDNKPKEIVEMGKIVMSRDDFISMQTITSSLKPYGLRTDFFNDPSKYGLPPIKDKKEHNDDITIFGSKDRNRKVVYADKDYPVPKKTKAFDKCKVFVPYAWGGGDISDSYSDIVIAKPYEICTETYQEQGCYDDFAMTQKHAKYIMTKFARALLYLNKHSQHSTTAWGAVPIQNFAEKWWDKSIKEIDEELMKKYKIPQNIKDFVMKNIQEKTEKNIMNYKNNR